MKAHELASYLPEITEDELRQLSDDIKEHGQREPIVMLGGKILDGRNRFAACKIAKVEPATREFGSLESDGSDPVAFVISENLKRRHLSDSDRARIAGELAAESERGRPKENGEETMTQAEAAELLNVKPSAVRRAVKVAKSGSKKLKKAVKEKKVSLTKAAKAAHAPKEKQVKIAKAKDKSKKVSPKEKLLTALDQLWIDNRESWNSPPMNTPAQMVKHFQKLIEKVL